MHHLEIGIWIQCKPFAIIWHISLFSSSKNTFHNATFSLCWWWWEHKRYKFLFIIKPVLNRNNAAICCFYCSISDGWCCVLHQFTTVNPNGSICGLIINCIVAWCHVLKCRLRSDTNLLVIDSVEAIWSLIHLRSAVNHIPVIQVLYFLWDTLLSFVWHQMHLSEVANRDKLTSCLL